MLIHPHLDRKSVGFHSFLYDLKFPESLKVPHAICLLFEVPFNPTYSVGFHSFFYDLKFPESLKVLHAICLLFEVPFNPTYSVGFHSFLYDLKFTESLKVLHAICLFFEVLFNPTYNEVLISTNKGIQIRDFALSSKYLFTTAIVN